MTAAAPAAQVRGLVKRFGTVEAVAGIDLAVSPGEVVGLLGPKGAGKTTTIRTLMGYLSRPRGPWRCWAETRATCRAGPGWATCRATPSWTER